MVRVAHGGWILLVAAAIAQTGASAPAGFAADPSSFALPGKVEPYPVVADIAWPEGPAFDKQGNLYFVNYVRRGTIGRRTPDGTVSVWIDLGGQLNAIELDRDGNLIVADRDGKRIVRISPERQARTLVDRYRGRPFLGPNDLSLDHAGNIYFTDPTGSSEAKPIGAVYRYSESGELKEVDSGLAFPNGIAVSPDDRHLFVGETQKRRILRYELASDGNAGNRTVFHQFAEGVLDGIAFDEYGRLWVTRWDRGTVDVLSPAGQLMGSIPAGGDKVSNLCWWGKSVFLTVVGNHSIHRLEVGVGAAK